MGAWNLRTIRRQKDQFFPLLDGVSAPSPDDLELMALEADELVSMRRQTFTSPGRGGPFVFTPQPLDQPLRRALSLVEGALILGDQPYTSPVFREHGGLSYSLTDSALDFTVDRTTKELCVPLTHFPLQVLFEGEQVTQARAADLYARLKTLFFRELIAFLKTLPEDPLSISKEQTPVQVQQEVGEAVGQQVPQLGPSQARIEPESAIPEIPPAPAPARRLTAVECKSLTGNQVKAILTRLLGDPVRIVGSHHIFKSPKNGIGLPLSLQGKNPVDAGSLRSNIEAWDMVKEWREERS